MTPLATTRLQLRAFAPGDADALLALFAANRDRLQPSFPASVAQIVDRDGAAGYIAGRRAAWNAGIGFWYGMWEGDRLVGQIQIKNLDRELGRAELAYLVDRASEGRGLVSEAVGRIVEVCFDELALYKVFLRAIAGNARSAAVAKRCGFELEGTLRGEFFAGGTTRVDVDYFGRLAVQP